MANGWSKIDQSCFYSERRNRLRGSEAKAVRLIGRRREETYSDVVAGKSGDVIRGTVLVDIVVTDVVSLLPPSLRLALEASTAFNVEGLTMGMGTKLGAPRRLGLRHALERRKGIQNLVY